MAEKTIKPGKSAGMKFGWGFFGDELKFRRETKGLTRQELGAMVFCTGSYIGQIETAARKPQPELAKLLDIALETGGLCGAGEADFTDPELRRSTHSGTVPDTALYQSDRSSRATTAPQC
ncbi:multiprotein-bridging factor 1 family protein [Kitasatospora sp. NPDC006697]|uniref:helix-turn-helix domain-containing protein n=1 Tax=Kitasatospora sp. NPDC006697 TaxID=3364020 RepID=UPI00368E5548